MTTLPPLNFSTTARSGRRLRCRRLRSWRCLLLAIALGACRDDGDDTTLQDSAVEERDAADHPMEGSGRDAGKADAATALDAGPRDSGAAPNPAEGGAPEGGSMDAATRADAALPLDAAAPVDATLLMDAASDAAEAAVQAPDARVVDAAPDAADGSSDSAVALPSIYDDDSKWLCRPGLPNSPCLQKLEVTEIGADGGVRITELPKTPADVAADCLYLYPTVDPGLFSAPRNLDFPQIDRASVTDIFFAQAVPFRGACALYAPLYRQMSLNSFEQEATREKGLQIAYGDLEAAFDYYLQHAAPGRPIVLIAHSQGSITMTRLLQRRFEKQPELLARLVVAVLAGPMGGFVVPEGGVVGGTFKQIPLCTAAEQNGCVLTYNSFAASAPPNADYGKVTGGVQAGFDPGCTSPPAGSGGAAQRLSGTLFAPLSGGLAGLLGPQFDFGPVRVRTRYARFPDFYTARCADSEAGVSYLRISAEPLPGDVRKDPVPYGNLTLSDRSLGLHGLDYTFVAAELLQAVQAKIKAHR
jgi:hypothetical protein